MLAGLDDLPEGVAVSAVTLALKGDLHDLAVTQATACKHPRVVALVAEAPGPE